MGQMRGYGGTLVGSGRLLSIQRGVPVTVVAPAPNGPRTRERATRGTGSYK